MADMEGDAGEPKGEDMSPPTGEGLREAARGRSVLLGERLAITSDGGGLGSSAAMLWMGLFGVASR